MGGVRLQVDGVRKRFGDRVVLSGVELRLEAGEILGLLGANGAGKSTLISIMSGSTRPDGGSVSVEGIDVARNPRAAAGMIGAAPQDLGVYPTLTVRENLVGVARLNGVRGRAVRERYAAVIEALDLESCARTPAGHLSGGQRRRLHFGMALTHEPRLLFLDEPTVGADVASRRQMLSLVRELGERGTAIVYTTHYLAELEQLPARIALLHDGHLRELGDVATVVDTWGGGGVSVRTRGKDPQLPAGWSVRGDWLTAHTADSNTGARLAELVHRLGPLASDIVDVQVSRPSLESAYLNLIGPGGHETTSGAEAADAAA